MRSDRCFRLQARLWPCVRAVVAGAPVVAVAQASWAQSAAPATAAPAAAASALGAIERHSLTIEELLRLDAEAALRKARAQAAPQPAAPPVAAVPPLAVRMPRSPTTGPDASLERKLSELVLQSIYGTRSARADDRVVELVFRGRPYSASLGQTVGDSLRVAAFRGACVTIEDIPAPVPGVSRGGAAARRTPPQAQEVCIAEAVTTLRVAPSGFPGGSLPHPSVLPGPLVPGSPLPTGAISP